MEIAVLCDIRSQKGMQGFLKWWKVNGGKKPKTGLNESDLEVGVKYDLILIANDSARSRNRIVRALRDEVGVNRNTPISWMQPEMPPYSKTTRVKDWGEAQSHLSRHFSSKRK